MIGFFSILTSGARLLFLLATVILVAYGPIKNILSDETKTLTSEIPLELSDIPSIGLCNMHGYKSNKTTAKLYR